MGGLRNSDSQRSPSKRSKKTKLNWNSLPFYGEPKIFFTNESNFFNNNNSISPRRTGSPGNINSGAQTPSGFFIPLGKEHCRKLQKQAISMMCWNAHSLNTIIKRTFIKTRKEDVIICLMRHGGLMKNTPKMDIKY